MKNLSTLLAAALVLFLFSCSKDNSAPNANSAFLPKTYTEDIRSSVVGNSTTTYTLTYDGHSRVVTLTATPAPPSLNFVYTYPSNTTATLDMYDHGTLSIHENFWVNSASFLDTTFQYDNEGDTTTERYVYNGNNQLMQIIEYSYTSSGTTVTNVTDYTYDSQGNIISTLDMLGKAITYTYYTDLPNNFIMGPTFLPQPAYFLKKVALNDGGTMATTTHYYTFDSQKRLTTDSTSIEEFDFTGVKTYTY